jgi:hypothetical protein
MCRSVAYAISCGRANILPHFLPNIISKIGNSGLTKGGSCRRCLGVMMSCFLGVIVIRTFVPRLGAEKGDVLTHANASGV